MTSLADKPVLHLALNRLAIAPENMRRDDDADDAIDDLAETLVVGQLLPVFVRATAEDDLHHGVVDYLIIDGRRRFLAWQALADAGRFDATAPLIAAVVCETPDEVAQAVVTGNTGRLDPDAADTLLAIHRLSTRMAATDIGRVLGLPPKRVKQYAAMGGLDIRFLQAFKAGKIRKSTLADLVRAKVTDPKEIDELATQAARGWGIHIPTDTKALAVTAPIVKLVGVDAYIAAGGTIEQDLFDEEPDTVTDIKRLHKLWLDIVRPVAQALKDKGLTVKFAPDNPGVPEGGRELPYGWEPADPKAATKAEAAARRAMEALPAINSPTWTEIAKGVAASALDAAIARSAPLAITGASIRAGRHAGSAPLVFTFFVDGESLSAHQQAKRDLEAEQARVHLAAKAEPVTIPRAPAVADTEGFQNALHEKTTRMAGRLLALSLADKPGVAFDALLAELVRKVVANDRYSDHLLKILPSITSDIWKPDPDLQVPILTRLAVHRDALKASGLHPFAWVQTLDDDLKGDLLALIVALQVDATEKKTTELRPAVRTEAAHIAAALDHYAADVHLPGEAFYAEFSKKALLGFLTAMDAKTADHDTMKREELAPIVARTAAEKGWVPPQLDFVFAEGAAAAPEPDEDEDDDADTFDAEEAEALDGAA